MLSANTDVSWTWTWIQGGGSILNCIKAPFAPDFFCVGVFSDTKVPAVPFCSSLSGLYRDAFKNRKEKEILTILQNKTQF